MKKIVTTFLCSLFVVITAAQDIITQKDGTDIQAKVTEVGIDQISYKKYSNPNGPTYIISKADVLMITYENGEREVYASNFETNTKSLLPQGMMTYNSWSGKVSVGGVTMENEMLERYFTPEDYKMFTNGRSSYVGGTIIGVIGAIPFGWNLGALAAGGEINREMFIGGGIVMVGGLVISMIGENRIKEAVSHYNSYLTFVPTINWGHTNDLDFGLALVVTF